MSATIEIRDRLEAWIIEKYGKRGKGSFAEALGLNRSQLSQYLSKTSPTLPGGEVLQRFAQAGMNVQWLLTGEGTMDAPRTGLVLDMTSPIGTYVAESKATDIIVDLSDPLALKHIEWTEAALRMMKRMVTQRRADNDNENEEE